MLSHAISAMRSDGLQRQSNGGVTAKMRQGLTCYGVTDKGQGSDSHSQLATGELEKYQGETAAKTFLCHW